MAKKIDQKTFDTAISVVSGWKRQRNRERDRIIYQQIFIDGMRNIDCAKFHDLSPTRIQQISRRIDRALRWIDCVYNEWKS